MPPKRVKTPKGGPQKAPKGAKKAKIVAPPSPSDSDDSDGSEEESSEEEMETKPVTPKNSKVTKKTPAPAADSDDDDDDDDSDDSEEEAKPVAKAKKEKKMEVEDDSDDDDDDDSDDDEEEEADKKKKAAPKLNGKKAAAAAAADSDEDDSDDEDDESEDDDDDSDEEEEVQQKDSNKRKKEQKDTKAKKVKTESDETVSIFCGNLDQNSTAEELEKFFKGKGIPITSARKNDNKRFGYVDLKNASDADKALALNGTNDMKIDRANSKPAAGGGNSNEDPTLFVKNLAETVTEDALKEFFPNASEVRLSKNRDGPGHRGFAHVVFADKSTLEKVLKKKQGADLEGQAIYLDISGPRGGKSPGGRGGFNSPRGGRGGGHQSSGEAGKTKVLFVKNLSYNSTEDSLRDAFPGASSARIAKDRDSNRSKGFGFVEFDSPDAAAEAFNEMKGQEVDGRQIFLDFASDRKDGGGGGGGRGGFRGGRGGSRGGGFRGGRGGRGGGRGFGKSPSARGNIQSFQGKKKTFADDSD